MNDLLSSSPLAATIAFGAVIFLGMYLRVGPKYIKMFFRVLMLIWVTFIIIAFVLFSILFKS